MIKKVNISQKNLMYGVIIVSIGISIAIIIMALGGIKAKAAGAEFESNRVLELKKMKVQKLLNEGK